jgi:chemotaxis protein methyltransferase WspC
MKEIENLLRQTVGLDAASIGSPLINRVVRSRMRGIGVRKVEDYAELLGKSQAEWNELVESLVVAETWFFREPEQFAFLASHIITQWLPKHRTETFRILSVPCSSGEEPYSLVMALRDTGLPVSRLRIDAVDISSRALTRAMAGVYRKNSFRGKELAFRDHYFQTTKEGFVLDASIRSAVNFYAANVLGDEFLPPKESYDCIFCRNLLIYFDRATQKRALTKIEKLLRPGGLLFVGPAEPPLLDGHHFVSANANKAFAFFKLAPHSPHAIVPRSHRAKSQKLPGTPRLGSINGSTRRVAHHPHVAVTAIPPKPHVEESHDLEVARQLADSGKLKEAAQICEAHLRKRNDSAEAYYLLGLVRDAAGDDTAVDCYRRALYLEPNHYESLLQMAMLSQKNGDETRAKTFRNRAQRVKSRV